MPVSLPPTAIVVLFTALRKGKKEPLIVSEEDVRENVVTYDDEGGGEEDTEAFDILALRNPAGAEELKIRRDVQPERVWRAVARGSHCPPTGLADTVDVCAILSRRLEEADNDTSVPPYDSLQTYAYEGQGSPSDSISSLGSLAPPSDLDYSHLDQWGPEFQKLAELYGENQLDGAP